MAVDEQSYLCLRVFVAGNLVEKVDNCFWASMGKKKMMILYADEEQLFRNRLRVEGQADRLEGFHYFRLRAV